MVGDAAVGRRMVRPRRESWSGTGARQTLRAASFGGHERPETRHGEKCLLTST